jgi:hypothetical protein
MDDLLIEAGDPMEPLVSVQMDDLLISPRVAESDVFAVGLRRAGETRERATHGHL